MTFDVYVYLIGQVRRVYPKWSDVSTMYSNKVVTVFQKPKKLSGAITARCGPRTCEQIEGATKCTKNIGKSFKSLSLTISEE